MVDSGIADDSGNGDDCGIADDSGIVGDSWVAVDSGIAVEPELDALLLPANPKKDFKPPKKAIAA